MNQRLVVLIGFLSILFLFGVQFVNACSCAGGANPCQSFNTKGGVIFIGTVTNVVDSKEKYGKPIKGKGKARKITIKVDEVFKGSLPSEVITSDDGYSCDNYPFTLGNSYLIYSGGVLENTQNILPVGLCSGTRRVDKAKDSIKFLRQMKNGVMPSILYGKVQRVTNDKENPYQPLSNTKVILKILYSKININNLKLKKINWTTTTSSKSKHKELKKKNKTITTITNEDGEYQFKNLEPGTYKISAALPNDLWMQEYRQFGTGGKPSCDIRNLYAFTNGSISGNVVNLNGTPAKSEN